MLVCGLLIHPGVKIMLRFYKITKIYPQISSLGMKIAINIVNRRKTPLYFHSRRENHIHPSISSPGTVNNKKLARHGLGSQC
jgi:hypothetical protein